MEEYPKEFAPTIEEYSLSENNLEFNRKQLGIQPSKMYWLLGSCRSKVNAAVQTNMDLRCSTLGHSRQFKHRNNPKISKQIPQNHRQRTLVRYQ